MKQRTVNGNNGVVDASEEVENTTTYEENEVTEENDSNQNNEEGNATEVNKSNNEKSNNGNNDESNEELTEEQEIESFFAAYINEEHSNYGEIENIRINENLSYKGTYIVLVDLDFTTKNRTNTANDMMRMVADDIAATYANTGNDNVSEIAVFWNDLYNDRDLKHAYNYDDGNFYLSDKAIN